MKSFYNGYLPYFAQTLNSIDNRHVFDLALDAIAEHKLSALHNRKRKGFSQ